MTNSRSHSPFLRNTTNHHPQGVGWLVALLAFALPNSSALAEYVLEEPVNDDRTYVVRGHLDVKGKLTAAIGDGKAVAMDLNVDAELQYRERRLPGAGRDALSLRALRHYDRAHAKINIKGQTTSALLRKQRKSIVAMGRRNGVVTYSPSGPMTYDETELLRMPGDSLVMRALLPQKTVRVGDKWPCDSWVLQMITGTEAVLSSELQCELISAKSGIARVNLQGTIEGATDGASCKIVVRGHYLFDIKKQYVKRLELRHTDKRSVGPVSPGVDVVATVVVERRLSDSQGSLSDRALSKIPLDVDESQLMLSIRPPWDVRFRHDRNWHLFHQSRKVAVLRLLDQGSLIAQCNVSNISAAAPGKHTSERQFQEDIRSALGDNLKEIEKAELLKSKDDTFRYRVTAIGESNGFPMTWIYYLCADPSGRQTSFVFAVETKLLERLSNRDLGMIDSLEFVDALPVPRTATP